MSIRRCLMTIAIACICSPASAAIDDPWAQVPALPTACYSNQDQQQWQEALNASIEAVDQAKYEQQDINASIRAQSTGSLNDDPFAMAQRMQQAMMNDPAAAQKMMEQMTQQSQQQTRDAVVAQHEKETLFEAESKTLSEQYKAALARAMEPAEARWNVLADKLSRVMSDFGNSPTPGWPDSAIEEWRQIQAERNKAYVANCATWWAKSGPIHAYLGRYKNYLVQERIPYEQRLTDEPELQNFQLLDVSTEGWRTTTDYEAAGDYMRRADMLFQLRDGLPRCTSRGISDSCM